MKVVIETLDNKKGYILTTNSGDTHTVKVTDDKIEIKNDTM